MQVSRLLLRNFTYITIVGIYSNSYGNLVLSFLKAAQIVDLAFWGRHRVRWLRLERFMG